MTPDDVVARAKELVGQEVLLTIRGALIRDHEGSLRVHRPSTYSAAVASPDGVAHQDLVDIQPAPLRIEPGELYADGRGVVYVGAGVGMLQAVNGERRGALADQVTLKGLRRVKVVDA